MPKCSQCGDDAACYTCDSYAFGGSGSDWQPIATHPTDPAARFDVWVQMPLNGSDRSKDGSYRAVNCRYCERQQCIVNANLIPLTGMIPRDTGIPMIYPSHWRAIPEPPPYAPYEGEPILD